MKTKMFSPNTVKIIKLHNYALSDNSLIPNHLNTGIIRQIENELIELDSLAELLNNGDNTSDSSALDLLQSLEIEREVLSTALDFYK